MIKMIFLAWRLTVYPASSRSGQSRPDRAGPTFVPASCAGLLPDRSSRVSILALWSGEACPGLRHPTVGVEIAVPTAVLTTPVLAALQRRESRRGVVRRSALMGWAQWLMPRATSTRLWPAGLNSLVIRRWPSFPRAPAVTNFFSAPPTLRTVCRASFRS